MNETIAVSTFYSCKSHKFVDTNIAYISSPSRIPNSGDSTAPPQFINADSSETSESSSLTNVSTQTQAGSDTAATSPGPSITPTPPLRSSSSFHTSMVADGIVNKDSTPHSSQLALLPHNDLKSPDTTHDEHSEKEGSDASKDIQVSFILSFHLFE
jgi:hypothetical protein